MHIVQYHLYFISLFYRIFIYLFILFMLVELLCCTYGWVQCLVLPVQIWRIFCPLLSLSILSCLLYFCIFYYHIHYVFFLPAYAPDDWYSSSTSSRYVKLYLLSWIHFFRFVLVNSFFGKSVALGVYIFSPMPLRLIFGLSFRLLHYWSTLCFCLIMLPA